MPDAPSNSAANAVLVPAQIAPTECGYFLVHPSAPPKGVGNLRPIVLGTRAETVLEAFEKSGLGISGIQKRLLGRLWPGPVLLTVPKSEHSERFWSTLRVKLPVACDANAPIRVLITDLPRSAVIMLASAPKTMASLAWQGFAGGHPEVWSTPAEARAAGVAAGWVVAPDPGEGYTGVPALRKPPTAIELPASGGYRILEPGAYEERFIARQMSVNVLFVCTGNTCRSPMAEAIARHELEQSNDAGASSIHVSSAGTAGGGGAPMTAEARAALEAMGVRVERHASRGLSRRVIADADIIYTMSRSHAQAVVELEPDSERKVQTLDPAGKDIADPIGSSQEVYSATAQRLRELIRARLKEINA